MSDFFLGQLDTDNHYPVGFKLSFLFLRDGLIIDGGRGGIIKSLYIISSLFFLVLGIVGIVVPVWPTAPFLLLSSLLAAKGSTKIHSMITHSNLYKHNLEDFVETRSMTRMTKVRILTVATLVMMVAFYFSRKWWARIIITLLVVVKYYTFIFLISTSEEDDSND